MKRKKTTDQQSEHQSSADAVKSAAEIIGKAIDDRGWVSVAELSKIADGEEISHELRHQAIRLLDRRGAVTARKGPNGELGWESLLGAGRTMKRYGAMTPPVRLRMRFITPPLGQISKDGVHFKLLVDDKGNVIFLPGQFQAMLSKAYRVSGLAGDEAMSENTIRRISVKFMGVQEIGRPEVVRRPWNAKKQPVGECLHEALGSGSTADWVVAFPASHLNEEQIERLLDAAQHIGFSPAGSGRGGLHGIFTWEKPE